MAFLAFFLAIPIANAAEVMRVTFVRHGESLANVAYDGRGSLDTSIPGPGLTPKGQQQAEDLVDTLGDNNYDAIYASTMLRTQQTATPMSQYLGLPIQVIPGISEIPAGALEGKDQGQYGTAYIYGPLQWAGLIPGQEPNLNVTQPGTDFDGNDFNAGVNGALKTMYDNGDRNAIVFSHGGTIMFWTIMNVKNLTPAQKGMLLSQYALGNTDYVVIEGNPEDGWNLVDWNGQRFSPEPTFEHEVQLQVRTLSRQLQQAADSVKAAFATRDPATIATAINRAVATASFSVVKFGRAINAEVIKRTTDAVPTDAADLQEKVSTNLQNVKAAVETNVVTRTLAETTGTENLTGATKLVDKAPATTGVKSKPADVVGNIAKPRTATDLSDGNKALPGVTKSISRTGERVREAVQNTSDQVTSSVQKLSDALKKVTSQAGTTGKTGATGGDDSSSAAASGEKDAA